MNFVMFSGQGAQKAGMGKELYDNFAICRQTFEEASDALGFDMARLCFDGELSAGNLNQTEFAQPALLTAGISVFRLLQQEGLVKGGLMGLSLGEYTALVAAEVLDFAQGVALVHRRGQIMAELAAEGGMMAVMGLTRETLERICKEAQGHGFVACANFNTPEQIVISGEKPALDYCVQLVKAAKGKAIPLKVAGPFHTPLMEAAATAFKQEFAGLKAGAPVLPIISNVTADVLGIDDFKDLPGHMARHMISPVRWTESVQKAATMDGTRFIELGSGNTLVNFVKKIDPNLEAYQIENLNDIRERL
jgi:[acyl-carrier-protein] S-malonyltransferase